MDRSRSGPIRPIRRRPPTVASRGSALHCRPYALGSARSIRGGAPKACESAAKLYPLSPANAGAEAFSANGRAVRLNTWILAFAGKSGKGDTMALDLETRNQLIDTVRRFVAERLRPLESQVAENDAVPDDVIAEMRELGLYGLSIPEEYGGLDLSMEDECLVAV